MSYMDFGHYNRGDSARTITGVREEAGTVESFCMVHEADQFCTPSPLHLYQGWLIQMILWATLESFYKLTGRILYK